MLPPENVNIFLRSRFGKNPLATSYIDFQRIQLDFDRCEVTSFKNDFDFKMYKYKPLFYSCDARTDGTSIWRKLKLGLIEDVGV